MERENILIREAYHEEWEDIMSMVWKVFLQFEAQDYSKQGVDSFQDFITSNGLYRMFVAGSYQMIIAIEEKKIVGMISIRDRTHISLLFVESSHHFMGIGKRLLEYAKNYLITEVTADKITVNSSPYAVPFYHKMGFRDTGKEMTSDGIRYTPMEFYL